MFLSIIRLFSVVWNLFSKIGRDLKFFFFIVSMVYIKCNFKFCLWLPVGGFSVA